MEDTWPYDLTQLLLDARLGNPAELQELLDQHAPYVAVNADYSALLVLRHFHAEAAGPGQRRALNCRPNGPEFQPGITLATFSKTSSGESFAYLPAEYTYSGLRLRGQDVEILRTDAPPVITNITELRRKLDFWGTFATQELRTAFDNLSNEQYAPRQPLTPPESELVIHLPAAGQLTYNPRYEWYEGSFAPNDQSVSLTIAYVAPPQQAPLLTFVDQQLRARFHEEMVRAMTAPMLALKNDAWLDEDEQPLSEAEFSRRVTVSSISFFADGSAAVYCDDDELFFGHTIEIQVDPTGAYKTANLAG